MSKALGKAYIGAYKGKKTVYVNISGMYEVEFDYKTLDLVKADDVHSGEWITFEGKADLEYFKKRYNKIYTYARRKAREYKNSKTKARKK